MLLLESRAVPPAEEELGGLAGAFHRPGSDMAERARGYFEVALADGETREAAVSALRLGARDTNREIRVESALLLLESRAAPPAEEELGGLTGAFYRPRSDTADRARAHFERLLADDETREAAASALQLAEQDDDSDIRGQSALLLLESRAVPPAEDELRALTGAFYVPNSDTGERARAYLERLLADDQTREATITALRLGAQDDDNDISSACSELLAVNGIVA